jgi:hypothetical protein
MVTQEVPPLIVSFAAQVKMTPIAWRFEPGCVVIVFEQGPKMRFDLPSPISVHHDPVLAKIHVSPVAPKPVPPGTNHKGKSFTSGKKPLKPGSKK